MMRTLRFGKVELDSTRERVDGHDYEDRDTPAPPAHFAKGTPWPAALPRPVLEERDVEADEPDDALTTPVPLTEPDTDEAAALPPVDVEIEIGTRTLMGIGARAVRSVARSGWVEARLARSEPRATPDARSSHSMRASIDLAASSSRRAIAHGTDQVKHAPGVQPLQLPPVQMPVPAPVPVPVPVPPAIMALGTAPVADPGPTLHIRGRGPARGKRKRTSPGLRVLGVLLLAVAATALAAYITTTVFYVFSTSWVMPAVVSQSDDKVVSLKSSLAAQQNQRDRLAAELAELARTLAAQPDPRSDVAQQARARGEVLQASIARQDEIIAGLEQSPYLRALADRAQVALVPYDNLAGVAPGTAVVACRVAMVMCREVGRVLEVLPGEVTFKHPRREKMMRGQMIELQLAEPEAAVRDVLFLGGAPLLL